MLKAGLKASRNKFSHFMWTVTRKCLVTKMNSSREESHPGPKTLAFLSKEEKLVATVDIGPLSKADQKNVWEFG